MKNIDFRNVRINDGFWKIKQDICKNSTVKAVYERFVDTYRFSALKCLWKEGDEEKAKPHFFWDSDVAKWIEGAAYILEQNNIPELEKICDEAIDDIANGADENGYFNCYFLVFDEEKFKNRDRHELYCLGHLIEAAIAYKKATGKNKLLRAMCKYADYVEKVFKTEDSAGFATPGHPELELALMKLYKETGQKRYAELAKFFIDRHGNNDKDGDKLWWMANRYYNQDEIPLRKRITADGHAVRALYLLSGMADVASEYDDTELLNACKRCFDNIHTKRMYITGGVGSSPQGEAFTVDYDLPNRTAYTETCAAIALVFFCHRMFEITGEVKYADTLERALYNGVLSGISMDGKSFFYENPLAIDLRFNEVDTSVNEKRRYPITERLEVFGCSCCPPNMVRFIPSVANYAFSENYEVVFINQYMDCSAELDDGKVTVKTAYPADGNIKIEYTGKKKLALRIPEWCDSFSLNCEYELKDGYVYLNSDSVELTLDMPVKIISANAQVHENLGRVAVTRGPVVYCGEGVDNEADVHSVMIDPKSSFTFCKSDFLLPVLKTVAFTPKKSDKLYYAAEEGLEETELNLIPYYAFANRGESDMLVWFNKK